VSAPRVSVILPVRDGEAHLEEAVRSILDQTFVDLELVVVDDGSVDGTARLLERLAAEDSRVQVYRIEPLGLVAALNFGIGRARGAYVARMDADDISLPLRVERQVAELDARSDLGVLGTQVRYIDAAGRPIGVWNLPVGQELVRWTLFFGTPLAHPSVMMRRELLLRHAYAADAVHAEDYDLWVRLAAETELDNVPEILFERRVHGGSVSDRNANVQAEIAAQVQRLAIAAALRVEPSEALVRALQRPRTLSEMLGAFRLILRLYRASPHTRPIRRDGLRRIAGAARAAIRAR
jgi:glycosyltransferase involved in cell wall biosynthesis